MVSDLSWPQTYHELAIIGGRSRTSRVHQDGGLVQLHLHKAKARIVCCEICSVTQANCMLGHRDEPPLALGPLGNPRQKNPHCTCRQLWLNKSLNRKNRNAALITTR